MPDAPTTGRRTAVRELLGTEAASGTVLVVLGAVALIWADGPAVDEYESCSPPGSDRSTFAAG